MSPNENIFFGIDYNINTSIAVGDTKLKVKGKGSVMLGPLIIQDVLLVPDIKMSFLSVGQLIEKGFSFLFKGNYGAIYDPNGNLFVQVPRSGRIFLLTLAYSHQPQNVLQGTPIHQGETSTVVSHEGQPQREEINRAPDRRPWIQKRKRRKKTPERCY